MTFDQSDFNVRCERGENGVRQLASVSDVVIIYDFLPKPLVYIFLSYIFLFGDLPTGKCRTGKYLPIVAFQGWMISEIIH
ncbi:MAG: hypothetical protein ACREA2_16425 [Blastocatellia bacterium]